MLKFSALVDLGKNQKSLGVRSHTDTHKRQFPVSVCTEFVLKYTRVKFIWLRGKFGRKHYSQELPWIRFFRRQMNNDLESLRRVGHPSQPSYTYPLPINAASEEIISIAARNINN